MDDSHNADVAELNAAIDSASHCNADIVRRQSPEGDLGILHAAVQAKQQELDRLQGVVDDKTAVNNTKWEEFDGHMQMISAPPACPGLPARTMPALDVYFEKSEYSVWFAAQQASYIVVRDAFVAADGALGDAIHAYNIQKAIRDVQFCDWKGELEAACAAFDKCFQEKSDFYTKTLVPRVTLDMNSRIEVKKAGDTVIHQINFLLGAAAQQETPTIDTSRYQIEFPVLPAKGLCDLSPLDAEEWVPTVECDAKPTWELFQNFCVGSPAGNAGRKDADLPQTAIKSGNVSLDKCKEECLKSTQCTAVEWYELPWSGNKCFHILSGKALSGSTGRQWRDAVCYVKA